MAIITVPESKKLKSLNEGFFDDVDNSTDTMQDDTTTLSAVAAINAQYEESTLKPKVIEWLDTHAVENYTINCTGNGILVDVDNHLILPNLKLEKFPGFRFNNVRGNCNFSNNRFTDFSQFPRIIGGNLMANFNYIRSFNNAPIVKGKVYMDRQRIRTLYKLNQENFDKVKNGESILENQVYVIPADQYGTLIDVNEGQCKVLYENNTIGIYNTDDVEVINGLQYLIPLLN